MRFSSFFMPLYGLMLAIAPLGLAHAETNLDKPAIEQIVHDYLLNNPAVLKKALTNMAEKEQEIVAESIKTTLKESRKEIFGNKKDPVIGNPNGKVNVAYFFYYQCGYCKKMSDTNKAIFTKDGLARVTLKDLPILGPESMIAARGALAAHRQGKYEQFHHLMMDMRGPISEPRMMTLASTIGLDSEKLKKDMNDPVIINELKAHRDLAQKLGISGTPAFLIEDTLFPGAISAEDMRYAIQKAASKKATTPKKQRIDPPFLLVGGWDPQPPIFTNQLINNEKQKHLINKSRINHC